jgi:hypothetical protein
LITAASHKKDWQVFLRTSHRVTEFKATSNVAAQKFTLRRSAIAEAGCGSTGHLEHRRTGQQDAPLQKI